MSKIVVRDGRPTALAWVVALVVLLVVGTVVVAHSEATYQPLTVEQARAYMAAHPDQAAQDIVNWDWVQHVAPAVNVPALLFVLSGRDLLWGWQGVKLSVTVPPVGGAGVSPLAYDIELKGGERRGFVPADRGGEVVLWQVISVVAAVGGAALGGAIGHAIK